MFLVKRWLEKHGKHNRELDEDVEAYCQRISIMVQSWRSGRAALRRRKEEAGDTLERLVSMEVVLTQARKYYQTMTGWRPTWQWRAAAPACVAWAGRWPRSAWGLDTWSPARRRPHVRAHTGHHLCPIL